MIQSNLKTCLYKGHQEYQVTHICTFVDCKQATRWACPECFLKGIHSHDKQNNNHLQQKKEILSNIIQQYKFIKKDIDLYKSSQVNFIQKILKECQYIQKSIIDYRNQYQIIKKQIQKIIQEFELCLNYLSNQNFQQLDDEMINQIVNIFLQKFDQYNSKNQFQSPLDNIKQQLYSIEMLINEYQNNQKNNENINLNDINYINQEIDRTNNSYYASSISNNEQYVAYGGSDQLLKIYCIKQRMIIKEIKLDEWIIVCQFTQDSEQLYVGVTGGQIYGYDVQDDFKEIYKQSIHSSSITNIITVQNQYLITCSDDKSIIKTDIKSKQQIFKLIGHTKIISAVDYNYEDEIVVSGSGDKSIKLWNCRDQSIIINKEQSHSNEVRQIQFINNNLNILSLDLDGNLKKWRIDLTNKVLTKILQFNDQNKIFNFYQANQDQNLLLICFNYFKIINQSGVLINMVEHNNYDSTYFDCKQLDNLKYILIRATYNIVLAIRQI